MTRRRDISGFSLIELIVVLALLSVVSTLGLVAFFRVDARWRTDQVRGRLYASADAIFAEMREDFGRVLSSRLSGVPVRGVSNTYVDAREGSRFWHMGFEDDQFILPVESWNPVTGLIERHNVMYQIARDTGGCRLVRRYGALEEPVPAGASADLHSAAAEVLALCAEYSDGTSWQRGWNRPDAPRAVRVSLTLMDKNRYYEQISQKAVFTINAR